MKIPIQKLHLYNEYFSHNSMTKLTLFNEQMSPKNRQNHTKIANAQCQPR